MLRMSTIYATEQPSRAEVEAQAGLAVLEFGANWCGICKAAQPLIAQAMADAPKGVQHIKVEDASGRPLGRSFSVKLWPTLIFLRDGHEVARVVRPATVQQLQDAMQTLR